MSNTWNPGKGYEVPRIESRTPLRAPLIGAAVALSPVPESAAFRRVATDAHVRGAAYPGAHADYRRADGGDLGRGGLTPTRAQSTSWLTNSVS
jgi:hypothetical protein